MRDGKYEERTGDITLTLAKIKTLIEPMSMLSMVEIHWEFQFERKTLFTKEMTAIAEGCCDEQGHVDKVLFERCLEEVRGEPCPFYPLFYRVNGEGGLLKTGAGRGSILYPPQGKGVYYRSEILSAIAWCERFPHAVKKFEYHGAQEFIVGCDEKPFTFVRDLFEERARIVAETASLKAAWKAGGNIGPEPYNILERVIKLVLNSIYGKMAQSIGTPGKLPLCSNPFYAGAITAGCRAELQLAALRNPHGIIFFATDAIVCLGPLKGLETVEEKVLGKWEHAADIDVAKGAVFASPGNYSFFDLKGKPTLKMRGYKIDLGRDFLMKQVRAAWKAGKDFIELPSTTLVTLGQATNALDNWPKLGTWKSQKRKIDLTNIGTKREKCTSRERVNSLVFVRPKENFEKGMSLAYYPDWLNEDEAEYLSDRESAELTENQIGGET